MFYFHVSDPSSSEQSLFSFCMQESFVIPSKIHLNTRILFHGNLIEKLGCKESWTPFLSYSFKNE